MFNRDAASKCQQLVMQQPVLTIIGPRQSGKTALVKNLFADYPYVNLEDPELRELAERDPNTLLNKYPDRFIIDEI